MKKRRKRERQDRDGRGLRLVKDIRLIRHSQCAPESPRCLAVKERGLQTLRVRVGRGRGSEEEEPGGGGGGVAKWREEKQVVKMVEKLHETSREFGERRRNRTRLSP